MFTSIFKCADLLLINVQFQEGTLGTNYLDRFYIVIFFIVNIKDFLFFNIYYLFILLFFSLFFFLLVSLPFF